MFKKLETQKEKHILNLVEDATNNINTEIKTNEYILEYCNGTIYGLCYFVTDKKTKYPQRFYDKEKLTKYLIAMYGKPTPKEKAKVIMEHLTTHNKNYTKTQYNYILELQQILEDFKIL